MSDKSWEPGMSESIPTGIHVVATIILVSIWRANCVCVEWIPKGFADAHSVSGSIQHCFAPLQPSRWRQEDLHTQFARRMETKVVVATTWIPIGIGLNVWMFWTTFVFMCKLKSDCLSCYLSHVIFHISHITCQMSNVKGQMLILILGTCWTTFVFMSMLKSHWL